MWMRMALLIALLLTTSCGPGGPASEPSSVATQRAAVPRRITIAFARVRDEVRERMRLGGIEAAVGSTSFHERVTDGVRAWQQQEGFDAGSAGRRR